MVAAKSSWQRTVDEAVDDLARHGFDSEARVRYWEERLRKAAEEAMGPSARMEELLRDVLAATYERMIAKGKVVKYHPGIARWTIERVKPELRAELDRRIMASANLIRLRRKQRIEETLARFSGWATSLPKGGSGETNKREEKARVKKPLASLPFEERRVLTDQGHKLFASLSEITATGGRAIAGIWRSHWRQPGYDYRPDHKERDGVVYGVRGAWAYEKGLAKKPGGGWLDDVTRPAEEPYCRCSYVWLYTLGDLEEHAPGTLTAKGRTMLGAARDRIEEVMT